MTTRSKPIDWKAHLPDGATIRRTGYVKVFSDARRENRFRTLYRDGMTIGEYIADGVRLGLGTRSKLRQDIRWDCDPKHSGGQAMIEVTLPNGLILDPAHLPNR